MIGYAKKPRYIGTFATKKEGSRYLEIVRTNLQSYRMTIEEVNAMTEGRAEKLFSRARKVADSKMTDKAKQAVHRTNVSSQDDDNVSSKDGNDDDEDDEEEKGEDGNSSSSDEEEHQGLSDGNDDDEDEEEEKAEDGNSSSSDEEEHQGLSDYELLRMRNIKRNNARLASLGLLNIQKDTIAKKKKRSSKRVAATSRNKVSSDSKEDPVYPVPKGGVYYNAPRREFLVKLSYARKAWHLGYFKTQKESARYLESVRSILQSYQKTREEIRIMTEVEAQKLVEKAKKKGSLVVRSSEKETETMKESGTVNDVYQVKKGSVYASHDKWIVTFNFAQKNRYFGSFTTHEAASQGREIVRRILQSYQKTTGQIKAMTEAQIKQLVLETKKEAIEELRNIGLGAHILLKGTPMTVGRNPQQSYIEPKVGDRVYSRWDKGDGDWFPGVVIKKFKNGRCNHFSVSSPIRQVFFFPPC